MTTATVATVTQNYYEGLADELQSIATAVRTGPHLSGHFADRLEALAQQMREDARLFRIVRQS
jgi:hypothetical protein